VGLVLQWAQYIPTVHRWSVILYQLYWFIGETISWTDNFYFLLQALISTVFTSAFNPQRNPTDSSIYPPCSSILR